LTNIIFYIVVGAISFWGPDIVISLASRGAAVDVIGVGLMTVLLPGCLLGVYAAVRHWRKNQPGPSISFFMLAGIWLGGPLCISIAHTAQGAGLHAYRGSELLVDSILLIPTFIMATYDGSLAGLLVASLVMTAIAVASERNHWIIPRKRTAQTGPGG
jgi:hypothetical protein